MPVTAQQTRFTYTANGVTTTFAYGCRILNAADLRVTVNGVLQSSGFSVTGVNSPVGGNVVFTVPPVNGARVVIRRAMSYARATDYQSNGDLLEATLDDDQDAPVMMVQQLDEVLSRTPQLVEDTAMSGLTLPDLIAGQAWRRNLAGLAFEAYDPASASLGLFQQSGSGAVPRTFSSKAGEVVSIRDFGAVCDFVTDDRAAIQAALNSGAIRVMIPANTAIGAMLTIPAGVELFGQGRPSIKKLANGDMVDMSANSCRLTNIRLEGQGSLTRTGRGIVIGAGTDQLLRDVDVADMDGFALEVTANDVAGRMVWDGGFVQRTVATNRAIKLPGGDSATFGDRTFRRLKAGGGVLFEISGASMTIVDSCNFVADASMFTANARQALFNNCRIAGSAWTLNGVGHLISNCSIAPDVTVAGTAQLMHMQQCNVGASLTLNAGATNNRFEVCTFQTGVTDNSGNASNFIEAEGTFTPTWGGDTTNPTIGNGTLTGRFSRKGKRMRVSISLVYGSTSAPGSGNWFFQLSASIAQNVARVAFGAGRIIDTGAAFIGCMPWTAAGAPKIYVLPAPSTGNYVNPANPMTWASGDSMDFSIEWELG